MSLLRASKGEPPPLGEVVGLLERRRGPGPLEARRDEGVELRGSVGYRGRQTGMHVLAGAEGVIVETEVDLGHGTRPARHR